MAVEPWTSPLAEALTAQFGAQVLETSQFRNQPFAVVVPEAVVPVLQWLRDERQFAYLVDVTAVDYPDRPERFEVIYILYSFATNERVRVKCRLADGASVASVAPLYLTADWLEREVFDMFGIRFDGHPNLKRILLPDEWQGHPLRKEYGITQMDNEWVQSHLGIESGQ